MDGYSIQGACVLVTGATGFVGSHLVDRLLAEGASVRCLLRPLSPSGSSRHLPAPEAKCFLGDLQRGEGLEAALDGADLVFHLAGVTKALHSRDYYLGNVTATEKLLQAMSPGRARLIHVSSLAAMGPSPDGVPLSEDAAPHPLTHYGKSKFEGEQALRRSQVLERATIIRPPVVYGPRDVDVFQVFKAAASGVQVRIGRHESHFSVIYIADLVDGLLLAAQQKGAGRTYFLAHPHPVSWSEFGATAALTMVKKLRTMILPVWAAYLAGSFADIVSRLTGRPGILSRDKVLDASQRYWICDPARAAAELGFQAQTSLREGVAATLAWYREAQWLNY